MEPRFLHPSDYHKGFLELLGQLTTVGEISEIQFRKTLISPYGPRTYVIEDPRDNKIIATASLLIEQKFIHKCGRVGHIEDVVVDKSARGLGLGKIMIKYLTMEAKNSGCYKVILDCSEDNVGFYKKCGFSKNEVMMANYLK